MEQIIGRISFYHELYLICLVLALLFLVISVTLYFHLNVKDAVTFLAEHAGKKEISFPGEGKFLMEQEILLIHTSERIG